MKQYSVKQYSMKQYIYIYIYPRTAQTTRARAKCAHNTHQSPPGHSTKPLLTGAGEEWQQARRQGGSCRRTCWRNRKVAVHCCGGPHVGSGGGGACHLAMLLTFRRRHHKRGRAFHRTYPTCRTRWTTWSCRPLAGHCAQSRPRAAPGTYCICWS